MDRRAWWHQPRAMYAFACVVAFMGLGLVDPILFGTGAVCSSIGVRYSDRHFLPGPIHHATEDDILTGEEMEAA